eukprot:173179-Lingulodinium_polyedra.AAC.1
MRAPTSMRPAGCRPSLGGQCWGCAILRRHWAAYRTGIAWNTRPRAGTARHHRRPCRWIAARRRYNRAADDAATAGCNAAAHAARLGRRHMFACIHIH